MRSERASGGPDSRRVSFKLADMIAEIDAAKVYASEMFAEVWRDARVERIRDGISEIQRRIIGRDLLRPLGA